MFVTIRRLCGWVILFFVIGTLWAGGFLLRMAPESVFSPTPARFLFGFWFFMTLLYAYARIRKSDPMWFSALVLILATLISLYVLGPEFRSGVVLVPEELEERIPRALIVVTLLSQALDVLLPPWPTFRR